MKLTRVLALALFLVTAGLCLNATPPPSSTVAPAVSISAPLPLHADGSLTAAACASPDSALSATLAKAPPDSGPLCDPITFCDQCYQAGGISCEPRFCM